MNRYWYAHNNPIRLNDPSGTSPPEEKNVISEYAKIPSEAFNAGLKWLAQQGKTPAPLKSKEEIASFVEEERSEFGYSEEVEQASAEFYNGTDTLKATRASDLEKNRATYLDRMEHVERSVRNFQKTDLSEYGSGEDVSLTLAIATREGGTNVWSTRAKKVVSGGQDTHKKGAAGLDNLWNLKKYFKQAGLPIEQVKEDDPDFKKKSRNPAWVEKRDLLFAQMITTAKNEKSFRKSNITSAAAKAGVDVDAQALWEGLSVESRRTWMSLYMSGAGYVTATLRQLIEHQASEGSPIDLNGIMTYQGFTHMKQIGLARGTALRAAAFDRFK